MSQTKTGEVQVPKEAAVVQAPGGIDAVWVTLGLAGAGILLFLKRNKKLEPVPMENRQDEVEMAMNILSEPRQVRGGRWVKYKMQLVECEPPTAALQGEPPRIVEHPRRVRM